MLNKEGRACSALLHTAMSMPNEPKDPKNVTECDRKTNSCVPGNIKYERGHKSDSSDKGVKQSFNRNSPQYLH